ncbi:uroporphyrin-III methyltransferase [Legionella norrlandica]|uniref:Uroporphyrin-III methyltransferase n=1 Tax=Legionella norrlandica TaxID=1498499 RepID=A0A0A2SNT4_9GAMM|nr:uroporphyrinogen-III C-methyltransferase [Legionella norrlandica]KGP62377.1 uroporphyrin-III methyltransferase [Legionella norrlandica]
MANSNDEQKKATSAKHSQKTEPIKSKTQTRFSSYPYKFLLSGLAFLFALIAITISIYSIQFTKQFQNHLFIQNKELTAELDKIKEEQNNTQNLIDTNAKSLQQAQNDFTKKINGLNKELQTAMRQRLYQNNDWLLLKARYYLELAQINAHWSDNFNVSVALLQQADNLLKSMNNPKIFTVRQIIAKEITQLKSIPTVDIAGILSQLDAAQLNVNSLSVQALVEENKVSTNIISEKSNTPGWRSQLQDSMNFLEKLIVVRRNNENIQPLISPLYEAAVKENIRLNLQEAQWAVLNNNPMVYQLAINQAKANLKKAFNENAHSSIVLLKQLNELQGIKLTQEKPVIGQAIPLINQMIDNQKSLIEQVNGEKGEN